MNRKHGNGVVLDGSIADCDVCAMRKRHKLAHPKKAKYATTKAPFQRVYGVS